jgi:RNA polymerase sigma factor (sigma-70 family)
MAGMFTRPSPTLPVSTAEQPAPGEAILVEAGRDLAEQLWRLARARGEAPETIAADLLRRGLEKEERKRQAEFALAALTPRQREVTRLAIGGRTNRQIAHALWLSPETVKTHLRRALEHFDVHSKAELRLLLIDLEEDLKEQ